MTALARWWAYNPDHWWHVARHPSQWPGIKQRLEGLYDQGYDYGIRSCVTWISTYGDLPAWRRALLVGRLEDISRLDGLSRQAARIMFDDPACTGLPGVLDAAEAGVKPLPPESAS